MLLILFFVVILNITAIGLTYYCLEDVEKKEKLIFITVGIAIIYMITSFVYWISTKEVIVKEVSDMVQKLVNFMFVPINALILLPMIAKSYRKYKIGRLKQDKFKNRCIVLAVIFLIVLILECSYFKDIQNGIIDIIKNNKNQQIQTETNVIQDDVTNDKANSITNQIDENSVNEMSNVSNEINSNVIS